MTHPDISKTRLGCDNDGGYVIHCQPGKFAYDGVIVFETPDKKNSASSSFDEELIKLHNADGKLHIERVVLDDPLYLSKSANSSPPVHSLPFLESHLISVKLCNAFVRINAGGLEYDIPGLPTAMSCIKQAVITINCVQPDVTNQVLQRFSGTHFLAHVHPRNSGSYSYDKGPSFNKIPDVMECTLLRISDFDDGRLVRDYTSAIPDPIIDMPTIPGRPDICMRSTLLMGCTCKNNKPVILPGEGNMSEMFKKADEAVKANDMKLALRLHCAVSAMPGGNRADTFNNIACGCMNMGLFDHAKLYLRTALKVDPFNQTMRSNMAACEGRLAVTDYAARYDMIAMQHAMYSIYWLRSNENIWVAMATIALGIKQMYHIATPLVQMACEIHPEWKELPKTLIQFLHVPEQMDVAAKFLEEHEKSVIPTNNPETAMTCIDIYTRFGRFEKAYDAANTFCGDPADKYIIIGDLHMLCNRLTDSREAYYKGLEQAKTLRQVVTLGSCAAMSASIDYTLTPEAAKKHVMQIEKKMLSVIGTEAIKRIRGADDTTWRRQLNVVGDNGQIKVGYVLGHSADSFTPRFLYPLLRNHNGANVEAHLFCMDDVSSYVSFWPMTGEDEKIKTKCVWHDCSNITCEEIVQMIRSLGIDIMVNIYGHSARGKGRIDLFLFRPAPIQVFMLGHSGTLGLSYPQNIDWKIVDDITDPTGFTDIYHTERLYRVPGSVYCYSVPQSTPSPQRYVSGPDDPSITVTGGDSEQHRKNLFIFGYCGGACRVSPATLHAWNEILVATPNSYLIIVEDSVDSLPSSSTTTTTAYNDISIRDKLLKFGAVPKQRIISIPPKITLTATLVDIKMMDVMLDAFPCCGITSVCEALSVGTLVVSMANNSHHSNAAPSILINSGFRDYVCKNEDQYVAKAIAIYNMGPRSNASREGVANTFKKSPICDGASYAQKIEKAYSQMAGAYSAHFKWNP